MKSLINACCHFQLVGFWYPFASFYFIYNPSILSLVYISSLWFIILELFKFIVKALGSFINQLTRLLVFRRIVKNNLDSSLLCFSFAIYVFIQHFILFLLTTINLLHVINQNHAIHKPPQPSTPPPRQFLSILFEFRPRLSFKFTFNFIDSIHLFSFNLNLIIFTKINYSKM